MFNTAETLARESGLIFQASKQPWDRTDLRLLVSMAVGHRENPWDPPIDVDHHYVEEPFDEDLLAAPYREDPLKIEEELYNHDLNVVYDTSGLKSLSHIRACSLRRLVVNLVIYPRDNDDESNILFLAINSITSASHFLEHVVTLYDVEIDEDRLASALGERKTRPEVAFAIAKMLVHWKKQRISKRVLNLLRQFATRALGESRASERTVQGALKKLKQEDVDPDAQTTPTPPTVSNPLKLLTVAVGLFDPDPIEVARQITLICHRKFATIHPLEFITAMSHGSTTGRTSTLDEFLGFGDSLTLLAADAFLGAGDRQAAFRQILEIAKHLAELGNLDSLSCFLEFLGNVEVRKIVNVQTEELNALWTKAGERDREEYDQFLQKELGSGDRLAIPNMRVEIAGVVRREGQPDYVNGLINWGKVLPYAQRCVLLNAFQGRDCRFTPVPQIERVILRGAELSDTVLQDRLEELGRASAKE
jgi:hypothetical protein